MSKWKYLIAYLAPGSAIAGLYFKGWLAPGSVYIGFILIPIVEGLFYHQVKILEEEPTSKASPALYNLFLYLNIPLLYSIVFYFLYIVHTHQGLKVWEYITMILNVGLIIGTSGINVAHELGHRREKIHHWLSWLLLLPAFYLHFFIEHNKGHHRYIGTLQDPATARKGESIYAFWWRSTLESYQHAWHIEHERLKLQNKPFWSRYNLMLWFQLTIIVYLGAIAIFFSWFTMMMAILAGIVGFLFLESVNYIEHYGLLRKNNADGTLGPVHAGLSWDAEQPLGRIFLYELTRHADHHTHAGIPYQDLKAHSQSPKLAVGYPASIVLALIPGWWFNVMDRRLTLVA